MSEVATIERADIPSGDWQQTPIEHDLQDLADRMVKKCGGNRTNAFRECVQILSETLLVERKQ